MGHVNERLFQHYISRTNGIDSQAIMMGEEQDNSLIDFVRSMNLHRDIRAPNPKSLAASGSRAPPSAYSRTESMKRYIEQQKEAKQKYQDFFQTQYLDPSLPDSDETSSDDEEFSYMVAKDIPRVVPKPSRHLETLLKYDKARAQVAMNFYPAEKKEADDFLSLVEAVQPLAEMANPRPWHGSYPLTSGSDTCTWCANEYTSKYVFTL